MHNTAFCKDTKIFGFNDLKKIKKGAFQIVVFHIRLLPRYRKFATCGFLILSLPQVADLR